MIYKYFHTIRYLKVKQIYNRILFNTITPKINNTSLLKLRLSKNNFCLPVQKKSSMLDNDTFNFLNQSESFSEIGWHNTGKKISKLWRYNQHYFNDLNSIDANKCKKFYEKLIENWIDVEDYIYWEIDVMEDSTAKAELYYTLAPEDVGTKISIEYENKVYEKVLSEYFDSNLVGKKIDIVERTESYTKDFKKIDIGEIDFKKGKSTLKIRTNKIIGKKSIDFRLLILKKKS